MDIKKTSLKDYSSLHVGGEGNLVEVTSVLELKEAVMYAKSKDLAVHVLGGGTNTYFSEELSKFLFITPKFKGIVFEEYGDAVLATAHAGEIWDDVVKQCVEKELWGIENLSYIPGTVGGAPVQNIGAYGVELSEVFESLEALNVETLEVETFDRIRCLFGYRDSVFKHTHGKYIILSIRLKLSRKAIPILHYKPLDTLKEKNNCTIHDVRDCVIATRKAKLPNYNDYPNCGSFFKNPVLDKLKVESLKLKVPGLVTFESEERVKVSAAWLIEHVAEMKGVRRGDVGTWPNQPLVIVNYGKATADDIDALTKEIREKVNAITGIVLEQEVNRVG